MEPKGATYDDKISTIEQCEIIKMINNKMRVKRTPLYKSEF